MDISELQKKVKEFEEKAGFDKTEFSKLIEMLEEEIRILESNPKKDVIDHQLTDLLILIMQVSNRYNTDFDKELAKWFDKSKKYLS